MPEPVTGLVSVIVPVFNEARFLCQALDSIVAQDYDPTELIVVDDGSTDDSQRLARTYPRACVIGQANQGCGAAKNTGLAAAHGEFLAFLDADDIWLPGKLRLQVETLRRNLGAGFTAGHMALFLEPGVDRPAWAPETFFSEQQPAYLPSGLMIRRSAFEQLGVFDPTFPICNDFDWLTRARDAGVPAVITPEIVVRRRVHRDNLTYRGEDRAQELLRITRASVRRKLHAAATP